MSKDLNIPQARVHEAPSRQPALVVILAHLISFVFHPLFIACYSMAFLLFVHPAAFTGFETRMKVQRLFSVFFNATFLPAFAVFILWRLKLVVTSISLRTSKERIIPYLIAMICYWWLWNVSKNLPDTPPVAVKFLLGSFLGVCVAWLGNIYCKISMHSIAMGAALVFFVLFSIQDPYTSGAYIAVPLLITGAVCTARFIVSDHTPFEIYLGLFGGMLAQWMAWQF